MQLSIYLLLDGTCKEALEFYQSALGGELTFTTVGASPMKDAFPPQLHGRVINGSLRSASVNLSASDWLHPTETPRMGNMVCLYLSGGTPQETRVAFDKLSGGGTITDPLTEQPFGLYGALNDKFGVRWMFHAEIR
jgi:PhnB protein